MSPENYAKVIAQEREEDARRKDQLLKIKDRALQIDVSKDLHLK